MKLTIIIPAYNEEKKIEKDILLADEFLAANNIQGEIIVVDDGSSDATYSKAELLKEKISSRILVLRNEINLGKGSAVKKGMIEASGEFRAYCDAGATVPYNNLLTGMKLLEDNICDIAHGSRMLPDSVIKISQAKDRKFSSAVIRFLVVKLLGVPNLLTDTQCGFKIYKTEAAEKIFPMLNTNGFMFEVENILRAIKNNLRITEFPIEWRCDRDSRITLLKTPWKVLLEIVKIKMMRID
ncbi:MAG: glycosyl transferase [Ignavibacteria bacterium]|nr:MAG: glycosyl transferase [Ignavibacteria bacterium]KAF0161789.1 MAG: glycosyl transferase [Ignavibacteria bacterium]